MPRPHSPKKKSNREWETIAAVKDWNKRHPDATERPRTRGDCVNGLRPCPWVGCRWHLALDVTGKRISYLHGRDVIAALESMPETCALDVADQGKHYLSEVAHIMNVRKQAVAYIEAKGLIKLKEKLLSIGVNLSGVVDSED